MEKALYELLHSPSVVAFALLGIMIYLNRIESARKKRDDLDREHRHNKELEEIKYRNEVTTQLNGIRASQESEKTQISLLAESFSTFKNEFDQVKKWVHDLKNFEMKEKGFRELFERRLARQVARIDDLSDVSDWFGHRIYDVEKKVFTIDELERIPEKKSKTRHTDDH